MGYRSDVRIATTHEGWERMKALAGEIDSTAKLFDGAEVVPHYLHDGVDGTVFGWDCVKWYEGYPEIEHVEAVLRRADEEGIPWMFCRVGEDAGDIEELQSGESSPYDTLRIGIMPTSYIAELAL